VSAIIRLDEEVLHLRRHIHLLEEENKDLRRRFAFLVQDLEQARAKVTMVLRNLQGLLDRVKAMETRMREDSLMSAP
jgi:chromosome segregation ATPase